MFPIAPPQQWVSLDDLIPREVRQGWGSLQFDRSVQDHPLTIGSRTFRTGLGTHADSSITYYLSGRYRRFQAWVGVDGEMKDYDKASVDFQVFLDGKKVFDSGAMKAADAAKRVDLDVSKASQMRLVVTDAGDGIYADHADWADARLQQSPEGEMPVKSWHGPKVTSHGMTIEPIDVAGVLRVMLDGHSYLLDTAVEGSKAIGKPSVAWTAGGWVISQEMLAAGHRIRRTQTLILSKDAVDCTVTIEGDARPFTAPIDTDFAAAAPVKIWLAAGRGPTWEDPLSYWRAKRELFHYGKRFDTPKGVSLPLASLCPPKGPRALTLAMSPADPLINLDLQTSPDRVLFSRTLNRIQKGRPITWHMSLVPVAPDCRTSLAWMVNRYPAYFNPPNPAADKVSGLGAYSGFEGKLDVAKMRRMDFKVNWKASIDFPYMGMFLPPVASDVKWDRFAGGGGGSYGPGDEGRYGQTSIDELETYNRDMAANGFTVLNYFNVTEFGGNITYPPPADLGPATWKDPERFVFGTFPTALLKDPKPTWTWGGAVILDCGDPKYRAFLLGQAKRDIQAMKSASGICIDRTDWLERVNPNANDGMTWYHDAPGRSLINSWKSLLSEMGPMMHKAGKVIFINDLIRRLDIMRQVDGIYDEFGYDGGDLNSTAFLCLRKPHIAWTAEENQLKPDPDAFFQRHLYMGAFPTAPVPGNDHSILPSAWADAQYEAYGPLFRALTGRKWDLEPGLVSVDGGKVNVFTVPGGYAIPITFVKGRSHVDLRLSSSLESRSPIKEIDAICPGDAKWRPLVVNSGVVRVPIERGCAMVRIRTH